MRWTWCTTEIPHNGRRAFIGRGQAATRLVRRDRRAAITVVHDVAACHYGYVEDDQEGQALAYCVVANVANDTAHGEGGLEIRAGIKHFAAGAKVWVLPPQWGDGAEKVMVVGRHRGSAGPYIRMVIPRRHLTNYRVRMVYSPALLRALTKPWNGDERGPRLWETREAAEETVTWWQQPAIKAEFDDDPRSAEVSDPPPIELQCNGKTYHLAHFNARRARYSSQPPPIEDLSPPGQG